MKESSEEFRKKCGIGDPTKAGIGSRVYGVPFVLPVTRPLLKLGLQAEDVATLWIFLGIIGGILYSAGNYWLGIAAVLVYHFSYILDGVDGAVARYRDRCTKRGVFLDRIGHSIVKIALLLGMGIGAYINPPSYIPINPAYYLLAGGVAATFQTAISLSRLKVYESFLDENMIEETIKKRDVFKPRELKKFKLKVFLMEFIGLNPMSLFYFATIFNIIPLFILFYAIILPMLFGLRTYKEFLYIKIEIDEKNLDKHKQQKIDKNVPSPRKKGKSLQKKL